MRGLRTFQAFCDLLEKLIEQQKYLEVQVEIQEFFPKLQTTIEYSQTLELIKKIPTREIESNSFLAKCVAELLSELGNIDELTKFIESIKTRFPTSIIASLRLELALAIQTTGQHEVAVKLLQELLSKLKNKDLGIAWVNLGWAYHELQKPWNEVENAFHFGIPLLDNYHLARALISYGYCLAQSGDYLTAEQNWIRALPLVKNRPKTRSFILHNLAFAAQTQMKIELAEKYFTELERLTRNSKAKNRLCSALNGLGYMRRVKGDFERSIHAYFRAKKIADITAADKMIAYWGIIRVYMLTHQPALALAVVEEAMAENTPVLPQDQLSCAKGMVLLQLNDLEGANFYLDAAAGIKIDSVRWLLAISRAELERRKGNTSLALGLLKDLPIEYLHVREEAGRLPALMNLMFDGGLAVPKILDYLKETTVCVKASNLLYVEVNNIQIFIPPTGKVAELLVFMLENAGGVSVEVLKYELYSHLESEKARKRVWDLVKRLQKMLGWKNSIFYQQNTIQLDKKCMWKYDIAQIKESKMKFKGTFLIGIYSNWVQEVRLELSNLELKQKKGLHELQTL
jgi:tetratricopeptide (TPR) repeat protein